MRRTALERQVIRQVASDLTDGRAQFFFGSRLNDLARGGDLDPLVESSEAVDQPARLATLIGARQEAALGEQRIDVLTSAPNLQRLPVHEDARRDSLAP